MTTTNNPPNTLDEWRERYPDVHLRQLLVGDLLRIAAMHLRDSGQHRDFELHELADRQAMAAEAYLDLATLLRFGEQLDRTIHLLRGGLALCTMPGEPGSWPEGHAWTAQVAHATCSACRDVHAGGARLRGQLGQ